MTSPLSPAQLAWTLDGEGREKSTRYQVLEQAQKDVELSVYSCVLISLRSEFARRVYNSWSRSLKWFPTGGACDLLGSLFYISEFVVSLFMSFPSLTHLFHPLHPTEAFAIISAVTQGKNRQREIVTITPLPVGAALVLLCPRCVEKRKKKVERTRLENGNVEKVWLGGSGCKPSSCVWHLGRRSTRVNNVSSSCGQFPSAPQQPQNSSSVG